MVWGCVAHRVKGPLIRLNLPPATVKAKGRKSGGGLNGATYIAQVVSGPLKEFVASLKEKQGRDIVVVKDGAPPHRGKAVDEARKKAGIVNLPHPPSSPDLNPIEPIWRLLKDCVAKEPGSRNSVKALWKATNKVWKEIKIEEVNMHTWKMTE